MSNSDPLATQIQIAKEAEDKYAQAREHFKARNFPQALDCFLFAFDNGHFVAGWGGVRLSYIPSEIAKLGEFYPPAIQALKDRRDAREKMIEDGETNSDLLSEWTSLNAYLKESDRELTFLDRLKREGSLDAELEEEIILENTEKLIERQESKRLEKYLNRLVWSFIMKVASYQAERDFPHFCDEGSISQAESVATHQQMAVEEGVQCFEIALGCGRNLAAFKILKYLCSACPDRQTFSALIKAGSRALRKKIVKS